MTPWNNNNNNNGNPYTDILLLRLPPGIYPGLLLQHNPLNSAMPSTSILCPQIPVSEVKQRDWYFIKCINMIVHTWHNFRIVKEETNFYVLSEVSAAKYYVLGLLLTYRYTVWLLYEGIYKPLLNTYDYTCVYRQYLWRDIICFVRYIKIRFIKGEEIIHILMNMVLRKIHQQIEVTHGITLVSQMRQITM